MNGDLVDLYLRLSVDREGKDALERQEADLRDWATQEGKTVRKVWQDSVSGYKDVAREDFDNAVKAVSTGEVGTLAVWKLDRLSRRGAGQVGLVLDDVEKVGGRLIFLRDNLDSTTPNSRLLIIMVSEQARAESANTSLRVRAKIAADASKGIPKAGTRSFGYEVDGVTLRPSEADLIRDATERYLAGTVSLIQIAKEWTNAGALTDGMKRQRRGRDGVKRDARTYWTATTVHRVLIRERNAGILIHKGTRLPESRIQPIIDETQLEALRAKVKLGTPVGARAQTLLGGVLRCECGAPMHGTTSYSQRKGGPRHVYRHYKCSQTIYDKTRQHSSIAAPLVDDEIEALILSDIKEGRVRSPKGGDHTEAMKTLSGLLTANRGAIEDLAESISDPDLKSIRPQLKGRLKVLEAEKERLTADRDALMADAGQSADLTTFFREVEALQDGASREQVFEYVDRFGKIWDNVPIETKQALIRSRYRPVVRRGGRGFGRVELNPVTTEQ
ncbi:recombinase family protein [Microbacterium aurugineum]|uniref:Recombinase family protein n=1 Tax=Microbacterium aurugineum TaxID=2851642 RepID=A0ABY4IWX3_9MICO|nr:recombinase family protein [Microbacterium aurugineum]UPL17253.1 recombinase family protein [Microbacterium aurugineum]